MPPGTIILELGYDDVERAATWLCKAFGFRERLRIGSHRAQLVLGEAGLAVVGRKGAAEAAGEAGARHSIMVRVADVDAHFERARQHGAWIVSPPTDYPYGERQYSAADPGGHHWTFSQSIADVDPRAWGGEPREAA